MNGQICVLWKGYQLPLLAIEWPPYYSMKSGNRDRISMVLLITEENASLLVNQDMVGFFWGNITKTRQHMFFPTTPAKT